MKRTGISYALLLIDLDHFKEVNDRFGHEQGDHVLQLLAGIMESSCRETDFIGRFGGEEFLVVLPGTAADRAVLVAEKIGMSVADELVPGVGSITVSIGVAYAIADDADEMEALRRADRNLYRAKGNGRNLVAGDLPGLSSAL